MTLTTTTVATTPTNRVRDAMRRIAAVARRRKDAIAARWRAYLHRAELGVPDALESVALLAERIDNPVVLQRVRAVAPVLT